MKKLLSLILTVIIVVSCVSVSSVYAESSEIINVSGDVYPESEHPYQNELRCTWEYTYPSEAEGLYITFSDDTSLNYNYVYNEEEDEYYYESDYIYLYYYSFDEWYCKEAYCEKDLESNTIYIPGNRFRIVLETSPVGNDYGFSIDKISDEPPENSIVIRYHNNVTEDDDIIDVINCNEAYINDCHYINSGYVFSGWSLEPDGKIVYYPNDIIKEYGVYDLYAVWTKLIIEPEDSFSFRNSSIGYTDPADGDYYMSAEHYIMMLKNLFKTFGLGPIPGPIAAAVLSTYPTWKFTGSCYGMAASVFLQYHGVADFLSGNNADHLCEVRLTPEVISMVNYYQSQAASSYLCENVASQPGTAFYSENLKNVYETLKNGSPVLLTYYKDDYLVTMGHTVTLTGAFEDASGNKFVVGYDSNYSYRYGECHFFRISPDYSKFYNCYNSPKVTEEVNNYYNVPVTGFNWTSDYEQFTSFDINGEGDPMVWYKVFFNHIYYFMTTLISSVF